MYIQEISSLKKERDAIILAHNYQLPEVQDVADFTGDSLALSRKAEKTNAKNIIFCGVHFMAETASIICPDKDVFIPDINAGCSLASSINSTELMNWKKITQMLLSLVMLTLLQRLKHYQTIVVQSSNAVKVVNSIPSNNEILFLPDMFLGSYVSEVTKRKNMYIWPGECHVHAGIRAEDINKMMKQYQNAEFLVHPECSCQFFNYVSHVKRRHFT